MSTPNPLDAPDVDVQAIPCGCRFASIDDEFVYQPCSPTCYYYAYVIEESRKLGHPIEERRTET